MQGNVFKVARVMAGKRQRDVETEANLPVGYLSRFEKGWLHLTDAQMDRLQRALPTLQKARAVMDE